MVGADATTAAAGEGAVTVLQRGEVEGTTHGRDRRRFVREVLRVGGEHPVVMVRRRARDVITPRGAVLLVHGFGQNRHAWHLAGRSFVAHLALEGFDVFNLDLRGHGRSRAAGSARAAEVASYVEHDVPRAVAAARAVSGFDKVFAVGHSRGGLILYAASKRLHRELAGVVTLAAPYRFGQGNPLLRAGAGALAAVSSRVDPRWGFPMGVVRETFTRTRALWEARGVPLPLRAWHPGAFEPALLEEYLARAFDDPSMGEFSDLAWAGSAFARDMRAAWRRASVPTLVIAGREDLLAPEASVRPGYDDAHTRDRTWRALPFGHGDLLLGREAPRLTWPEVTHWLLARAP